MQGDNHQSEPRGDAVHVSVRPDTAFIFYWLEFAFFTGILAFLIVVNELRGGGYAQNPLVLGAIASSIPVAILLIMLFPTNWRRRRYAFTVTPASVVIDPARIGDGIHWGAILGSIFRPGPKTIDRTTIREVVVRNAAAGSWSHNMTLGDLATPNRAYLGLGTGGVTAAVSMAAMEEAAAGVRRLRYAMTVGPRMKLSYHVALRTTGGEHVIGGGLDQQGAIDLANDALHILSTLPMERAA